MPEPRRLQRRPCPGAARRAAYWASIPVRTASTRGAQYNPRRSTGEAPPAGGQPARSRFSASAGNIGWTESSTVARRGPWSLASSSRAAPCLADSEEIAVSRDEDRCAGPGGRERLLDVPGLHSRLLEPRLHRALLPHGLADVLLAHFEPLDALHRAAPLELIEVLVQGRLAAGDGGEHEAPGDRAAVDVEGERGNGRDCRPPG